MEVNVANLNNQEVCDRDVFKPASNVVSKNALRKVQKSVLRDLRGALSKTFGPNGSNTLIIKGNTADTISSRYSKDGHTVLKNILYQDPIEMSIKAEIEEITHHVESTVGDGTTSAVLLSSYIFELLCGMEENKNTPYAIIKQFKDIVELIKERILENSRETTIDDIYEIAYISTNGNAEIADNIYNIYKEYGLDSYISVDISPTEENMVKIFDGMTLDVGYSDAAYVNTINSKVGSRDKKAEKFGDKKDPDGACVIDNPRIYHFTDPVDTPDMIALFERILEKNVFEPYEVAQAHNVAPEPIPTVIITPKLSRDINFTMEKLVSFLLRFSKDQLKYKPPICIVTNISPTLQEQMDDISKMCACKKIVRYIDPDNHKADIDKGVAPTLDTITEFYGTAEKFESDVTKCKFINPSDMIEGYSEDGNPVYTETYELLINFLEAEYNIAKREGENPVTCGNINRRLRSLKSNMVEYLIGGVSVSDRDALRDLVTDAVLNCRSAVLNGVGQGANFEGFKAITELCMDRVEDPKDAEILRIIKESYQAILVILYSEYAEANDKTIYELIVDMIQANSALNLHTGECDGKVLCSIDTDITIIDCIAKIVMLMFTANQSLLQAPILNRYSE